MWDLPGPGLEPVSPALAGGFLTTAPPGKPRILFFIFYFLATPPGAACGTLVPRPGIKRMPPAVEAQSLNHWTAREVPDDQLFKCKGFGDRSVRTIE